MSKNHLNPLVYMFPITTTVLSTYEDSKLFALVTALLYWPFGPYILIILYTGTPLIGRFLGPIKNVLTAVFFETGAMPVPTKSQNPTICG